MHLSRKRLLASAGGITAVAAAATLILGATLGLFSATPQTETNNFTSGTVTLTSDATGQCVVPPHIVPGDFGTCTFVATYTGNVSAFVGLTNTVTGALFDGTGTDDSGANHLVVAITDAASTSYSNNTSDRYVATDSGPSNAHTFTVTWSLPSTADNSYQNLSAVITLTVKAVQSAHNGSCTTAGSACSGTSWS